jgi:serine/threonine-protein kinase
VSQRHHASDPLEWHLGVLQQLCNAVSFALDRGVLHRDLKPANVMIGSFGEVYLLDWGVAVSLTSDASMRIPQVGDAFELVGTPCYLAPEMLGDPSGLSTATDVYLLGATLYELIEGTPPHRGTSVAEVLASVAARRPPTFSAGAPPELAAICARCLEPDPARRLGSAEELRLAIRAFLEHRGAARLASESEERLRQLSSKLRGPDRKNDPEIHRLFGECRFGFEQALRIWPANPAAISGLRQTLETMVEHLLARGDATSASVVLSASASAPPGLTARVQEALTAQATEQERLRALVAERDNDTGRLRRRVFGVTMGIVWAVSPLSLHFGLAGDMTLGKMLTLWCGLTAAVVAVAFLGRSQLRGTLLNRAIVGGSALAVALPIAIQTGASWLGWSATQSFPLLLAAWSAVTFMVAITADRRFLLAGLGYLLAFFGACYRPDLKYLAVTAANLVFATTVVVVSLRAAAVPTPRPSPP